MITMCLEYVCVPLVVMLFFSEWPRFN